MRLTETETHSWLAEKKTYENYFFTVLGYEIQVIDIPEKENELGYTSANNTIHLKYFLPAIMSGLPKSLQAFFRKGVFTHETLHKIFSDFSLIKRTMQEHRKSGIIFLRVFSSINNALEDMSIEYFSKMVIGGSWLKALRYTIKTIYQKTPNLETMKTPFGQFENALIQFGDLGLLKGYFTFPEARKAFVESAEIFFDGTRSLDAEKRIQAAMKVTEISRPLWDKTGEDKNNLLNEISEICENNSLNRMPGGGSEEEPNKSLQPDVRDAEQMPEAMKKLLKDLKKQLSNSANQETDTSESDDTNDISGPKEPHESDDVDASQNINQNKSGSSNPSHSYKNVSENSESQPKDNFNPCNGTSPEDYEPTDEELEENDKNIEKLMDTDKYIEAKSSSFIDKEISVKMTGKLPNTSFNKVMGITNAELYSLFINKEKTLIKTLSNQINELLKNDLDENDRCNSGNINIKRYISRPSGKIFDRRRDFSDKKSVAVIILVDESGSMCSFEKDVMAKQTTIILTEALQRASVPVYVMGYTADTHDYADHMHYVLWDKKNNASMLQIHGRNNNYDGLSIRYAHKILQKRPETHKIMFLISDGQPQCRAYTCGNGIPDTENAVNEVRKDCILFSIGIGTEGNVLQKIYRKDFINITNPKDLIGAALKIMKNTLKKID